MTESSAAFGDVTVTVAEAHVAEVEMHRPPANYFDSVLLSGVVEAVDWAAAAGARAVVLCSEGRHFCAGLDFGSTEKPDPEALATLYGVARSLVDSPLPIVVAVQGSAIGGGMGLALAGDFRVAAPASRFAANFARLGFHQGFGISLTLPATVGRQNALDLLTTGRRIDGDEALAIGLCDRLDDDPRAGARCLATEIAASAPLAVRSIRRTLRADVVGGFAAMVDHERAEQLRLMETADFREGIAASMERRPPEFTGE
ncbi:MAG: enoyl-CoA hydratase/isomerase family protein [Acidimicrobiales bacterium]|jgi:enoyl-CoA hydratase/carnithine racemase